MQLIDRQYDDQYRNRDFKIGSTLQLRLPTDYVVGNTASITPQATVEQEIPLVVGTQANVSASFTSADFALKIDDFADRFLLKMTNDLAAYVAQDVMSAVNGTPNLVANFDGSGDVIAPTMDTFLAAGATLDNLSALRNEPRKAILSPNTMARCVSSFAGLFNPAPSISENYRVGAISGGVALGIQDWRIDQTVQNHTYGAYGTPSNVNGASQTGSHVTVVGIAGPLNAGDIITLPGVYAVNKLTKQSLGSLQQFVVTAHCNSSATSIPIYPAIIPVDGTPNTVPYANVTASPTDGQPWVAAVKAGATIRENLVFRKEAFALVVADLPLIRNGVVKSARESYDGVSLRMVEGYAVLDDLFIDRVDILYGYAQPRADWCVIVADAL